MKNLKNVTINLPALMFEAAGFSPDEATIMATNGAIVFVKRDLLDLVPQELKELFDELGISLETVRAVLAEDNAIAEALAAIGK